MEGTICAPQPLLLVTLRGGAKRLDVRTECGHRYAGAERPGAVSFVPAGCGRKLTLHGVKSEWASLALDGEMLQRFDESAPALEIAPFSNVDDPFIASMLGQLETLLTMDGQLDRAYCEIMAGAVAAYLLHHYGRAAVSRRARPWKLPPRAVRRIAEYVGAHLSDEILVSDLAALNRRDTCTVRFA